MDAPSAAILNSLKYLSNFDDELLLISPTILEPIIKLKEKTLKIDIFHLIVRKY